MERITRKHLEHKVEWLKKEGFTDISLDHHQPGGSKYTWAVENAEGSCRLGWSGRMTARECLIYLNGMLHAWESKCGDTSSRL